jgi:hypothetical protein
MRNCSFVNNTAASQSALKVQATNFTLLDAVFEDNSANATDAGGLSLSCSNESRCDFYVANSTFKNNSALLRGGGLAWSYRPTLENITYADNRAVYGPNVASFGVKLVLCDSKPTSKMQGNSYVGLASGQRLPEPVVIALVDHEGLIVRTDNSSIGQIYAEDSISTSVIGVTRVSAKQGVYTFTEAIVIARPGLGIKLKFASDALTQLSNADELRLEAALRACVPGEAQVGQECVKCQAGTYSLDPSELCKSCPDGATCYGGSLMVPKAEYWRSGKTTANFIECPNPAACLGSPYIVPALTGLCARGYRGNLCHSCEYDFSRSSTDLCARCPDKTSNALRLVGLVLGVCLLCGVLVWSSLKTAYQPQSLQSIYLRIFTGYLQLITLTTQLDLDWPAFVLAYFEVLNYPSSLGQQLFSVDCYLAGNDGSTDSTYFDKLVILAVLPLFLGIFTCIYWGVVYFFRRKRSVFKIELVATLMVLFFLMHPSLVKEYFNVFNCRLIEGQLWLNSNLNIKCFDDRHLTYALTVAFPSIIVWGIGVPSLILGRLIKGRSQLYQVSMKGRFGFFYNGFKMSHFYWEFLILYRKIIIIVIVVFLGSESIPVQALSLMLVLLTFLFLQYSQEPYTLSKLNHIELRGILVSSITIYCGLYYLTRDLGEEAKIVLMVVMVGANCFFFYFFVLHFTNSIMFSLALYLPFLRKYYPVADPFTSVPVSGPSFSTSVYTKSDDPTKFFTLALYTKPQPAPIVNLAPHMDSFYESQMQNFYESQTYPDSYEF